MADMPKGPVKARLVLETGPFTLKGDPAERELTRE